MEGSGSFWKLSAKFSLGIDRRTAATWRQSKNVWQRLILRSIPKEAFADSFQKLYERCQQCVVKDGDYFEGQ
jgi:hypothetical protein